MCMREIQPRITVCIEITFCNCFHTVILKLYDATQIIQLLLLKSIDMASSLDCTYTLCVFITSFYKSCFLIIKLTHCHVHTFVFTTSRAT